MNLFVVGCIGILLLLIFMSLRMPVALTMFVVGFAGCCYLTSVKAGAMILAKDIYSNFSSYSLSVVPMFILMGFLAFQSGIGTKLYSFAYKWIGHFPGGLAIATQVTCGLFGAICGSNTATAATIGAIAIPEMKKYNYKDSLATAAVAAGGGLGVLIPPSVIFILYGIQTEVSIGKLFLSGILPGILLMSLYIIIIYVSAVRNPTLAPAGPRFSWKERLQSIRGGLLEVIIIFAFSLGGLFAGWFTPTEAGAVGAIGVLIIAVVEKELSWEKLKMALFKTTQTTAMIMLLVAGATVFSHFMAISQVSFYLATWTAATPAPAWVVVAMIIFIYLVLGCFIAALPLVLMTIPIFYPVVVTTLGFDPIWFGVIMVLVVEMGIITPPVGVNVYVIKGIAKDVPLETIFSGIWIFLLAQVVCVGLIIAFPQIALFLPNLMW
ncbi:MAG: TRAP transporter large permease [Clostridiaceae bacterium]|nr:TRAP transporter large permease [Clostridiaceae bacterium]